MKLTQSDKDTLTKASALLEHFTRGNILDGSLKLEAFTAHTYLKRFLLIVEIAEYEKLAGMQPADPLGWRK